MDFWQGAFYKMSKTSILHWLGEPEPHNYPAALSFLSLIFEEADAQRIVEKLRAAPVSGFKAKDIFRASNLLMLNSDNAHLRRDEEKIQTGTALSPILLVRASQLGKVIVADGYHRLCAVYLFDEDALISCKIV